MQSKSEVFNFMSINLFYFDVNSIQFFKKPQYFQIYLSFDYAGSPSLNQNAGQHCECIQR